MTPAATTASATSPPATTRVQTISFARHGQAQHNVRAEAKRDAGCSFDEFIETMRGDDAFDADLTDAGRAQAAARSEEVDVVVASPLSRAVETARLLYPGQGVVCCEPLREWMGEMQNSRRRAASDLAAKFPGADVSNIAEADELWEETLETEESVATRGLAALEWLARRPEDSIGVVAHGGLLAVLFDPAGHGDHTSSRVTADSVLRPRFGNCEVRKVTMTTTFADDGPSFAIAPAA
mmetsp:Transcript_11993/g.36910  ORF Transcript_11993/g.36910 Transcript_11993/m.36910 type:complete len:238 (-) Transcript_11993:56-769(-)